MFRTSVARRFARPGGGSAQQYARPPGSSAGPLRSRYPHQVPLPTPTAGPTHGPTTDADAPEFVEVIDVGSPPAGGWPVTAVIFDFHSTLVSGGDPCVWLTEAWHRLERPGEPADAVDAAGLEAFLDRIWEHARPSTRTTGAICRPSCTVRSSTRRSSPRPVATPTWPTPSMP